MRQPVIMLRPDPFGARYNDEVTPPPNGVGDDSDFISKDAVMAHAPHQRAMDRCLIDLTPGEDGPQ